MRCYLVEKRITSLSDELAGYAYSMFHGLARRPGAPYPAKAYRFGMRTPHVFHLTLNVRQTAPIIQPHLDWIVSEPIREIFDPLPRVKILPTEIEKVFDLPMRIEDEAYREDTDEYLLEAAHEPALVARVEPRYELIVASYDRIGAAEKGDARPVEVPVEMSSVPLQLELSETLFRRYPIFYETAHFLREDVFDAIERHLDRDFFACTPIEVPADPGKARGTYPVVGGIGDDEIRIDDADADPELAARLRKAGFRARQRDRAGRRHTGGLFVLFEPSDPPFFAWRREGHYTRDPGLVSLVRWLRDAGLVFRSIPQADVCPAAFMCFLQACGELEGPFLEIRHGLAAPREVTGPSDGSSSP